MRDSNSGPETWTTGGLQLQLRLHILLIFLERAHTHTHADDELT